MLSLRRPNGNSVGFLSLRDNRFQTSTLRVTACCAHRTAEGSIQHLPFDIMVWLLPELSFTNGCAAAVKEIYSTTCVRGKYVVKEA